MKRHRNLRGFARLWLLGATAVALTATVPAPRAWDALAAQTAKEGQDTEASVESGSQAAASGISVPLPKGKKLILSDGSYQIVREYQREGDRVRYYSLERSAWEEIPSSLVDWDATQKAEADRQAQDQALTEKMRQSEQARRVADIDSDRSFEVRPGLILPDGIGLYALDGDVIRTMRQDRADSRLDKGRATERIMTGMPMISSKRHVEIPGKHARLRLQSADPEFYFRTADGRDPQMILLHLEIQGDKREVETVTTNIAGQSTHKDQEWPMQEWDAARGLYRFTVEQTLEPGEYALIEATSEGHDAFVWDFGVDAESGAAGESKSKNK